MRETEFCRKVLNLGTAGRMTLVYFLLAEETELAAPGEEYGVEIYVPETGERQLVRAVTPSRREAEALLDRIATGFVTPVTLRDVVYDWLCSK